MRSPAGPSDELAQALRELVQSAHAAWPGVELSPEVFSTHVRMHLPPGVPAATALRALHADDLYLACACARGDAAALAAFERRCLGAVDDAAARQRLDADATAEIKQRIRHRVLVADAGPPRIAGFSGRGSLRAWVYVMATREALLLQRRTRREVPIDDRAALDAFVTRGDAEIEHAKDHYRQEFKQAFDAALRGLPAREQTLLRQHVIDGLGIDQLGALYHVHRSTAARSLERARQAVLAATRARLRDRLAVRSSELDSILRMIRSRLEVSLRGLLRRRR